MDTIVNFQNEIIEDLKIDQVNILDKQLMLPALKHKWVARLIQTKQNKNSLEKKKKELQENVLKKLESDGIPKGIPKISIKDKVNASDVIKSIDLEIKQSDLEIEYLEKIEKIFSSMTYDISNATKLLTMEMS
jgi:hypothetical protein